MSYGRVTAHTHEQAVKHTRVAWLMDIDEIQILPKTIVSSDDLEEGFRELFGSAKARKAKGVVYFFMSEKPIPRVRGESKILYIGKTKQSISARYLRYSNKLAQKRSGAFYRHILNNYGGISLGYLEVDNPKETESMYFKKYCDTHLEYPPKSKVG